MDYLLHHLLRTSTDRFPEKEALVDRGRRLNYTEVWTQTAGLAAALRETGLQRSDRVGIFLDPCIEQPLSIFAVSRADCAFVPIHHSLFPAQVQHIAADCGMKVLITDQRKLDRLQEYLPQLPALQHLIVVDGRDTVDCLLPVTDFATACEQCAEKQPPVCIEKDLAAIIYTSGSTGKPKGVMLSHTNIIAGASIVSEYLNITRNDRLLAALPFSFDAGLNQLTTAIQQGATCVMIKFLLAREVVNTLESEKITGLAGVPPLWGLLAQPSSTLAARELPELRYITNTGGALPQHVLQALRQAQPNTHVYLMYGLTEAFRSTYLSPSELDRRTNSIGRAIPNTEILVINERGEQCGPGESGELVHHGPTVSLGYWGQPELTNQVLRPHPFPPAGSVEPPKVCYSGDIVRMDEDGYLYFAGRRDNLLKTSGFRVSPNEVEAQLCDSGKLRDAAVVGVPDDVLGQRIVAYVTAAEGSDIDPAELLAWSATQMPRYMVPARVEVLEALPRTASGKIDYPSLRMRACNAAETAGVAQVTA